MAKRNGGSRGRSRKRSRVPAAQAPEPGAQAPEPAASLEQGEAPKLRTRDAIAARRRARAQARPHSATERIGVALSDSRAAGERPRAPWHPWPLSELLILVGSIGFLIGLHRGFSNGGPTLLAGLAAVAIGTYEVTLREHLGGYRSHAVLLALLPVLLLHSVVVLVVAAVTTVPPLLNVGLLLLDGALFAFLYKYLRGRFRDQRGARMSRGRR